MLEKEVIIDIIKTFDSVEDIHNIRSRGYKDYVF